MKICLCLEITTQFDIIWKPNSLKIEVFIIEFPIECLHKFDTLFTSWIVQYTITPAFVLLIESFLRADRVASFPDTANMRLGFVNG